MSARAPRPVTQLTGGEQSLLDAFEEADLSSAHLNAVTEAAGNVVALVKGDSPSAAAGVIREFGLPTRKLEAYHYTDLRALMRGPYTVAERPSEEAAKAAGAAFPRLAEGAAVLHFRDGHFFEMGEELPEGVTMSVGRVDGIADWADPVGTINTMFSRQMLSLAVEAGAKVERTIGLAATPTGVAGAVGAHAVAIDVGEGATCRLVERSVGPDGQHVLTSSRVDLTVGDGADVTYVLSIEDGDAAERLGRLSVRLGRKAKLKLIVIAQGGVLVRQELDFTVAGEEAALEISGINLVGGDAHIDITSRITHEVEDCTAQETIRNVVTGKGRGVFQGQINVRQAAQRTDARMACNTLLLSDHADFSVKPELEIFADDVQCAHGATVADLEESYLFYLRARGIDAKTARKLLIHAFVSELLEDFDDEAMVERLDANIDRWMDRHV